MPQAGRNLTTQENKSLDWRLLLGEHLLSQFSKSSVVVMSNIHKHLDLISGVIARMANNSFEAKRWAVTLTSATLALAFQQKIPELLLVACVPNLAFWVLDSFYLHKEREFRALFEIVRKSDENSIDFSMVLPAGHPKISLIKTVFAKLHILFYGALLLIPIASYLWIIDGTSKNFYSWATP